MLNVGCGSRLHRAWINLDVYQSAPGVIVHDILRGLPFDDCDVDVCYHSHVLEHLTPAAGERLIGECFRVLRPGGILRVAVPDLERIVRSYLSALERVADGIAEAEDPYDWFMLELFDQMVRPASGGEIGRLLRADRFDRAFVRAQVGAEAEQLWADTEAAQTVGRAARFLGAVRKLTPRRLLARSLRAFDRRTLAGAMSEGLFRSTGEVHRWMYDRFSLSRLLTRVGFTDVVRCTATESAIPGFEAFELDAVEGRVRKPDSIFVEGRRPAH